MEFLIYSYIFLIGLFFGSFYNVVGMRVPLNESLMGFSHCDACGKKLNFLELFPVFGYLLLKGKCKQCGTSISYKYPLIELVTALLFVYFFYNYGDDVLEYIVIVLFVSMMVIVTVSDIYYREVPDIILILFLPLIFVLRILSPIESWYDGIIGGVLGFTFMYLMALYGKKRFKKEALGGGDIKLYAIVGLFLGYMSVFLSLFFAAIIAIIYSTVFKKKDYIPFVPFIFAGAIISYIFGETIITWYLDFL